MADGESLAISVPASETRVLKHFQERMPYGLFVPGTPSPLHDPAVRAPHIGAAAAPRLGGSIGCTDYGSDGRHRGHHDHTLLHEHSLSLAVKIRPEGPSRLAATGGRRSPEHSRAIRTLLLRHRRRHRRCAYSLTRRSHRRFLLRRALEIMLLGHGLPGCGECLIFCTGGQFGKCCCCQRE
jgi:hypothetical protein